MIKLKDLVTEEVNEELLDDFEINLQALFISVKELEKLAADTKSERAFAAIKTSLNQLESTFSYWSKNYIHVANLS